MLSQASRHVADAAKQLSLEKYRESLEVMHFGEFVCIEPVSSQCFPGTTSVTNIENSHWNNRLRFVEPRFPQPIFS